MLWWYLNQELSSQTSQEEEKEEWLSTEYFFKTFFKPQIYIFSF